MIQTDEKNKSFLCLPFDAIELVPLETEWMRPCVHRSLGYHGSVSPLFFSQQFRTFQIEWAATEDCMRERVYEGERERKWKRIETATRTRISFSPVESKKKCWLVVCAEEDIEKRRENSLFSSSLHVLSSWCHDLGEKEDFFFVKVIVTNFTMQIAWAIRGGDKIYCFVKKRALCMQFRKIFFEHLWRKHTVRFCMEKGNNVNIFLKKRVV